MRTIIFIVQKEFRQVFRDRVILRGILLAPILQLLILPLAANYEIKNINLAVVDHDHSAYSEKLISKIFSSGYFRYSGYTASYRDAYQLVEQDKADLLLEIPDGFEKNLVRDGAQKLFIAINAINGVKAGLGGAYLSGILGDYNDDIRMEWTQPGHTSISPTIDIATSYWYNPLMIYLILMIPGILVNLMTSIGGMQTSLNIVKEKEMGTIEQLNVTPIKKYQFILGKLLPFAIIGLTVFTIGLLIGRIVYGIIPLGNIGILYLFAVDYLFAILGFGLLISTFCNTQQQAISLIFFFLMIINMMSGLFTPLDSMPGWAIVISRLFPTSYFIEAIRMIVLKGSGAHDLLSRFGAIFLLGLLLNTFAIWHYRKTS